MLAKRRQWLEGHIVRPHRTTLRLTSYYRKQTRTDDLFGLEFGTKVQQAIINYCRMTYTYLFNNFIILSPPLLVFQTTGQGQSLTSFFLLLGNLTVVCNVLLLYNYNIFIFKEYNK